MMHSLQKWARHDPFSIAFGIAAGLGHAPGGCFVFNVPGLEAAIQEAYDAGAREKCGRAI